MTAKRWGRVGDVPVIGAGTYASNAEGCAVSATGDGEYFIRASVARDICAGMAEAHASAGRPDGVAWRCFEAEEIGGLCAPILPGPRQAQAEIDQVGALGGSGGVIVMNRHGRPAFAMNTSGMYRGAVSADAPARVAIYGDEELLP